METTLTTISPEDVQALVQAAPEALNLNQTSLQRALDAGDKLLAKIKVSGMSAELDQELNKYLGALKVTHEKMTSRRKGVTQLFDQVKSEFTTIENRIAPGKAGSIYDQIQKVRNDFAAQCAEENRKAEAAARLEQQKITERVNLKSDAERFLRTAFEQYLNLKLSELQQAFDTTNLDSLSDVMDYIVSSEGWVYPNEMFVMTVVPVRSAILDAAEVQNIISNARLGKFDAWSLEFANAISQRRSELMEKIPGKETALQDAKRALDEANRAAALAAAAKTEADKKAAEQAQALAAERQRVLAAEEEQRRLEAETKAKQEEADRTAKATADAEMQKSTEIANSLFDAAVNAVVPEASAQVRESYEIEVLAAPGWMLLFQFWFQNEGSKLSLEKFDSKKLESIRKFCEKQANKTGEIIQSPLLKYREVFKAVTTR